MCFLRQIQLDHPPGKQKRVYVTVRVRSETSLGLFRFTVLSLEYLKWLVCYASSESVPALETHVDACLRAAALALENPQLSEAVSALEGGLAASTCALSLHALLKYRVGMVRGVQRKVEVAKCLAEATESPSACDPVALAAVRLNEMFSIVVAAPGKEGKCGLLQSVSKTTAHTIESLLIGMARMPIFNTSIRYNFDRFLKHLK